MGYTNNTIPRSGGRIALPNWSKETAFLQNKNYEFRKAGLLDIPFIFNLIQDGCEMGSFTEKFITSKGWGRILKILFLDVLAPHRNIEHEGYDTKLLVFTLNDEEVGFMKIDRFTDRDIYEIELCAVAQEYRNQKIGLQMIRMFIEDLPSGATIVAYCTKYSRAMQHILKMLKFQRDKKPSVLHSELFHFTKSSHMT